MARHDHLFLRFRLLNSFLQWDVSAGRFLLLLFLFTFQAQIAQVRCSCPPATLAPRGAARVAQRGPRQSARAGTVWAAARPRPRALLSSLGAGHGAATQLMRKKGSPSHPGAGEAAGSRAEPAGTARSAVDRGSGVTVTRGVA